MLGVDAIPGDPAALEALVARLRASAGHVEGIRARVSRDGLGGSWSGSAADAFRASLDDLPGELDKLHASYSAAGDSIAGYTRIVADLQGRARWLAGQIVDTESELEATQARHATAQSEMHTALARHAAAADPLSKGAAQTDLDRATAAAAAAQAAREECAARISSLQSAASLNREQLDRAASVCAAGLAAAGELGMQASFGSWINRIANDLSAALGWGGAVATLVGDAALITVRGVEFGWNRGIPRLVSQVASYIRSGGKGLSLRLISQLRGLQAGEVADNAKLLQALERTKGVGGWSGILGRFPGIARFAGAVDKVATPVGLVLGAVQYAVDNRAGIGGGLQAFVQHRDAAIGFMVRDTLDGTIERNASFGIVHVLSLGMLPDNADGMRQQLAVAHLAFNPQPPANFNHEQNIAARAALKYTGTGWNALPLVGGAFTSTSAAQQALYQGVLGNDMLAMIQTHDVVGATKLAHWIAQQPYGSAQVAKPYLMIAHALKTDTSFQNVCAGPQQAQAFVMKALGKGELQTVLQGATFP